MSENQKKVCRALNYFEVFLAFVSAVSGCVSISKFPSLVDAHIGITSSTRGIKLCAINAGIKSINQLSREKKRTWSYSAISKNKIKSKFNPSFDF